MVIFFILNTKNLLTEFFLSLKRFIKQKKFFLLLPLNFFYLLLRTLDSIPLAVETRFKEIAAEYGLDYDTMCVNDNTNCPY
jgi:hypothetical protein